MKGVHYYKTNLEVFTYNRQAVGVAVLFILFAMQWHFFFAAGKWHVD